MARARPATTPWPRSPARGRRRGASGTPRRTPGRAGRRPRRASARAVEQLPRRVVGVDAVAPVPLAVGVDSTASAAGAASSTARQAARRSRAATSASRAPSSTRRRRSADVIGLRPRSRWIVVTLVTPVAVVGVSCPLDPARRLLGHRRVVQHAPRHHQPARRVELLDRAVDRRRSPSRQHDSGTARPARASTRTRCAWKYCVVNSGSMIACHTRSAGADVGLVDVQRLGHGLLLRRFGAVATSTVAAQPDHRGDVGSAYLEIQRSWISRIGTGLR